MTNKRLILTDSQLSFLKQLEKHDRIVVTSNRDFYWPAASANRALGKRIDGRTVYAAMRRRWVSHPEQSKLLKRNVDFFLTKTAAALQVLSRVKAGQNVEVQKKRVA